LERNGKNIKAAQGGGNKVDDRGGLGAYDFGMSRLEFIAGGRGSPHDRRRRLRYRYRSRQAVVTLGLILLIATPIMRVAVSMVGFNLQRDRTYTAISALVLIVLLISSLLGKVE
jgi:hypothetical protein